MHVGDFFFFFVDIAIISQYIDLDLEGERDLSREDDLCGHIHGDAIALHVPVQ